LMRMIGRERMALAGPKALNFCTEQLRAGRGDAPKVTVSDRHIGGVRLSPQSDLRAMGATAALWGISHGDGLRPTDECTAATPRRGHVDDGMCCASVGCVGGSAGSGSSSELHQMRIQSTPQSRYRA
jgi:hypothetical protein